MSESAQGPGSPEGVGERLRDAFAREDSAEIALLVRDHMYEMWVEHTALLPRALGALSDADYAAHPALVLTRDMAGIETEPDVDVPERMKLAEILPTLPRAQQTQLVYLEMNYARYRHEPERALDRAADLRARLRATRTLTVPQPFDTAPLWLHGVALTETLFGDTSEAIADLRESRRMATLDERDPTRRHSQSTLALLLALRGNIPEARDALAEARTLAPGTPAPWEYIERTEAVATALIATETMAATADDAIAAIQGPVTETANELWPVTVLLEGRHALVHQRPAHVLELAATAQATRRFRTGTLPHDVIASLTGNAFLELGDLTAARDALAGEGAGYFVRVARLRELIARGAHRQLQTDARQLLADPRLPLVHRAETMLISAWGDWLHRGRVDATKAMHVTELVVQNELLRALATVPRDALSAIEEALPPERRDAFTRASAALPHRPAAAALAPLSDRERSVLAALADESSMTALGAKLYLSPNTVKTHLRSVYRKLGVRSREEALDEAVRLGILRSPSSENPGS